MERSESATPTNVAALLLHAVKLLGRDRANRICSKQKRRGPAAVAALLIAAFVSVALPSPAAASHPAEGFGAHTPGGTTEVVYRITTLADSGPGSLRDALSEGNRLIVFDVAGEIVLRSELLVRGAFVTIAGDTAPPPGITLRGAGLQLRGTYGVHDIIVRGLRIRDARGDGLQIAWGAFNILVDHVSIDGSGDGNIDITHGAHDVTVQWSLLGQTRQGKSSLVKTMVPDAPAETNNVSMHHTIFTGSSDRNPRISHLTGGSTWATEVTADVRNNIIANWAGGLGTDVQCGAKANIIGNVYSSPASGLSDQLQAIAVRTDGEANCPVGGLAYVAANVSVTPLGLDINSGPWVKHRAPEPFPVAAVTTAPPCEAATATAAGAGVRPLDAVDRELLAGLSLGSCGEVALPDDGVPPPPPDVNPDGGPTEPVPGDGEPSDPGEVPPATNGADVVTRSASAPSEVARRARFSVSDVTANIGTTNAGPFKIGVFMSSDARVTRSDVLVGQRRLDAGLLAGGQSAGATLANINRVGTWWLGVCADWRGTVHEGDESNNCLVIGTIVVK